MKRWSQATFALLVSTTSCATDESSGTAGGLPGSGDAVTVVGATTGSTSTGATCSDAQKPNACGGCTVLSSAPGSRCTTEMGCSGKTTCAGTDAVSCDPATDCHAPVPEPGRVVVLDGETIGGAVGECTNVATARDGEGPFHGSGMIECNWDGVRKEADWSDPLADVVFDLELDAADEYFLRFKQRVDRDFDIEADGAKFLRIGGNNVFQYDADASDAVHYGFCPDANCTSFYWNFWSKPMKDKIASFGWHEWAIYVRGGDDGAIKVWLDGEIAGNENGGTADYSGPVEMANMVPIHIGSNWSSSEGGTRPSWAHDADNHRYLDDLEVYTGAAGADRDRMESGTIGK